MNMRKRFLTKEEEQVKRKTTSSSASKKQVYISIQLYAKLHIKNNNNKMEAAN